jgi:D-3-phosphoglycerate dehydrogenase / 2-oxoglutarate reductase
MRKLPHNIDSLKAGKWQHSTGRTLFGKTLGVYGYAETGRRVAAFGRAFGMDVQVWGRGGSQERAAAEGLRAADSREAFFATSDVLSLHMRLAPETTGLVTAEDLARMKPDSVLVNTSRAPLVGPGALEAALETGRPAMAAVDVFETEPVLGNHSLLRMDNAICTPHIGYATQEQLEDIFEILFDGILAYARGEPSGAVNAAQIALKGER